MALWNATTDNGTTHFRDAETGEVIAVITHYKAGWTAQGWRISFPNMPALNRVEPKDLLNTREAAYGYVLGIKRTLMMADEPRVREMIHRLQAEPVNGG